MGKKEIIIDVAKKVNTDPRWLDALINFETAGTYSPSIKNPYSSARGLIQVIDATAISEFGAKDSLDLVNTYDTFESQMYNVVLPYLKKYAPLNTEQKLYMSVFYPDYMHVNPLKPFPKYVQNANPGIRNPKDYIQFVKNRVKKNLSFSEG